MHKSRTQAIDCAAYRPDCAAYRPKSITSVSP